MLRYSRPFAVGDGNEFCFVLFPICGFCTIKAEAEADTGGGRRSRAVVGPAIPTAVPRPQRRRRALAGRRAQKPQIANIKKQTGSRRERRCLENVKVFEPFWVVMLTKVERR